MSLWLLINAYHPTPTSCYDILTSFRTTPTADFEFEGYLDDDEGLVACTSQDDELQRSPSLDRHITTPSMSSLSGRRRIYAPLRLRATFYSERRFFTAYLDLLV